MCLQTFTARTLHFCCQLTSATAHRHRCSGRAAGRTNASFLDVGVCHLLHLDEGLLELVEDVAVGDEGLVLVQHLFHARLAAQLHRPGAHPALHQDQEGDDATLPVEGADRCTGQNTVLNYTMMMIIWALGRCSSAVITYKAPILTTHTVHN